MTIKEVQVVTIKDSFISQGTEFEQDAIDDYYEYFTACYINNEGMHCITNALSFTLKMR